MYTFQRRPTNLAKTLYSSAGRTVFAKLSLLDHLCDPQQYPLWHKKLPETLLMLPEVKGAVDSFKQQKFSACDTALERAAEIIESIPQMHAYGVQIALGRLHCALDLNMHIIEPSKWRAVALRALHCIAEIVRSTDLNDIDEATLVRWMAHATLFSHKSQDKTVSEFVPEAVTKLEAKKSARTRRVRFMQSLASLSTDGYAIAFPSEVFANAATYCPKAFPGAQNSKKAAEPSFDQFLESITLAAAELHNASPSKSFQSLFTASAHLSKQASESERHQQILEWLTNGIQCYGEAQKPVEGKADRNVQSENKETPFEIQPELYVAMCLSINGCPLETMQQALKASKSLPDEKADTREILTAMCLRGLALNYQYNYVYFSGLYNKAIQHLEAWLKRRQLPDAAVDAIVNKQMRAEYVCLLLDLGQRKEAESLKRRYGIP